METRSLVDHIYNLKNKNVNFILIFLTQMKMKSQIQQFKVGTVLCWRCLLYTFIFTSLKC